MSPCSELPGIKLSHVNTYYIVGITFIGGKMRLRLSFPWAKRGTMLATSKGLSFH